MLRNVIRKLAQWRATENAGFAAAREASDWLDRGHRSLPPSVDPDGCSLRDWAGPGRCPECGNPPYVTHDVATPNSVPRSANSA